MSFPPSPPGNRAFCFSPSSFILAREAIFLESIGLFLFIYNNSGLHSAQSRIIELPIAPDAGEYSKEESGIAVSVVTEDGTFDEPVTLSVAAIDAASDAYATAEEELAKIGHEYEGMVAFDIHFTSQATGAEVEPNKPVDVKIEITDALAAGVPEEALGALTIAHIFDNGGAEVVSVPAEENEDELVDVAFDFSAEKFSTYTITWGSRSVTVHYGYMSNGGFVSFESAGISSANTNNYPKTTLTASNGANHLLYDFPGYSYKETRYDSPSGTQILPYLYYDRNYGLLYSTDNASAGAYNWNYLYNNDDIYVIYEKKSATQGYVPSGEGGEGGETPVASPPPVGKKVVPNGNGTYDITLSVTGQTKETEKISKASVIVIVDTSGSMDWNMAGQSTSTAANKRINIAKNAVNELADTLLSIVDEKTGDHLVQMALITFDEGSQIKSLGGSNYTTSLSTYQSAVNGIRLRENGDGATNWESALLKADSLEVATDAPTYVIFVSDGDPTYRNSRTDISNSSVSNYYYTKTSTRFGNGSDYNAAHYNAAKVVASDIVSHGKEFYTIGLSSQGARMQNLAVDVADASHYFPGNSVEDLTEAFSKIASAVRDSLGYSDVSIDDGVTDLTSISTDALTGDPVDFVYRKGTNSTDPTQNPVWDAAPEAEVDAQHHVSWDPMGDEQLENGVTYSVTFTVWPSQAAYDLIADVNNGIIRNADGSVKETTTPAAAYEALTAEQKAQIVINASGQYTLLTNTNLNVSYKYNGQESSAEITGYENGAMGLATTQFAVTKAWLNQLPQDSRTAQMLKDDNGYLINSQGEQILDDAGNPIKYDAPNAADYAVYYIDLIVTKGGETYTEIRLTNKTATPWKWDKMFVAPGVITTNGSALTIREEGADVTVVEKPSDAYYWELSAQTYRPMVIDGTATMLVKVEENIPSVPNNTVSGNYYNINGVVYEKLSADATISAVNQRRSYLNVTKTVSGDNAPADALFEYTLKLTDPNGEDLWFSAYDPNLENDDGTKGGTVKDLVVTGATAEEGNTGYWHVPSGQEFTFKIKAGWNVRFTNLFSGTTYEITESISGMEDGFVFDKVSATAKVNGTAQTYNPTIAAEKINGTIENPNTDYTVTYANKYLGVFYVYHSSDLEVQRFPMAENGVPYSSTKTFDIYALTKTGTLYGGYYKDYAGKSEGFNAAALDYSGTTNPKDSGKAYSYQYIKESSKSAWTYDKGYAENGKAMVPTTDAVYYLKEVPTGYLMPYTHYTYYRADKKLGTMWSITGTDDLCYSKVGFKVQTDDKPAVMLEVMTITPQNNSSSVVNLTAAKVYKSKGVLDGYLGYADITDYIGNETLIQQYWTTKDGITVFGLKQRTLSYTDTTITGIKKSDTDYKP